MCDAMQNQDRINSNAYVHLIFPLKMLKAIYLLKTKILAMIAAEKRHEDDLYAALWKQDEQVKAAREVAETAEQLKRNQGRKSTVRTK